MFTSDEMPETGQKSTRFYELSGPGSYTSHTKPVDRNRPGSQWMIRAVLTQCDIAQKVSDVASGIFRGCAHPAPDSDIIC
jgi:hypothetical protein